MNTISQIKICIKDEYDEKMGDDNDDDDYGDDDLDDFDLSALGF